jgi:solute carrier family 25 (mitochondrial carnitine/acylcarnitine transporter), member 20/29
LVAVGHPFDTTKVKLQTSNDYKNAMDCVRQTLAKEGVRGLFRGMLTPLIFVTPLFATCFWGYDLGQKIIRSSSGVPAGQKLSLPQICFAGGFSAIPATFLMTPIERVKVLLQAQKPDPQTGKMLFRGPVDVVKHLYGKGGIRSIYKGTVATIVRDGPGSVAYFGVYEWLKRSFNKEGELNKGAILFAGGISINTFLV